MSTKDDAERQLRAAQQRVRNLNRVPDRDVFTGGTVLRWKRVGVDKVYVAVKHSGRWSISGRDDRSGDLVWDTLLSSYLASELEFFQIAAEWDNRFENPPEPSTEVYRDPITDRWKITDTVTGHTWNRDGNTWVLEKDRTQ